MENTQNQTEFDNEIYRYCEIIYNMLQNNPKLYDELLPKSTFKLISSNEAKEEAQFKIAA